MDLDDNVTDGITRDGEGGSGGTIRMYNPDTIQHGHVLAPPSLIVFAVFCIGVMLAVLGRGILLEMSGSKVPTYEPTVAIAWAFFGFILPALTANAIMMNWSSSRWLIVLFVIGAGNLLIFEAEPDGIWSAQPRVVAAVVGVTLIVSVWLFASPSIRRYYAQLRAASQAEI